MTNSAKINPSPFSFLSPNTSYRFCAIPLIVKSIDQLSSPRMIVFSDEIGFLQSLPEPKPEPEPEPKPEPEPEPKSILSMNEPRIF